METSLEVGGSRFTSMEIPRKLVQVDLLPWKLVKASMEVRGIFYCRWKWKLPLLPSMAASMNIFRGSFHCFHQLHLPLIYSMEASMSFHIPLHTSIYFHEYHKLPAASTRRNLTLTLTRALTLSWSYLHGSWRSNSPGSWWWIEAFMEVDEATAE